MLYNPMLFEHQYKNKLTRPMNVTFAVPPMEEVCYFFFVISVFLISIEFLSFYDSYFERREFVCVR